MADILADVKRVEKNTQAEFTGEALKIGQWAICLNTDNPVLNDQLVRRQANGDYKFYNIESLQSFTVVDVNTTPVTAETNTIYFVDTTAGDITVNLPNATENVFQTRIYKDTDINSNDVIVTTVGGTQLIGGSSSQLIQGESEGIFCVEHTDSYNIIQDNRGKIPNKLSRSTMIISGFTVTPTGTNLVDISDGIYAVEDPDGLTSPTSEFKRFDGVTGYAITGASTQGYTTLQLDTNGDIKQTLNNTTEAGDWTLEPRICAVVHIAGSGTVEEVAYWWTVGQNPSMRLNAYLDFVGVQIKDVVVSHNGTADLKIAHTSGELFGAGLDGNFTPSLPDVQPVVAATPVLSILYGTSASSPFILPPVALVDPANYDLAGAKTAVGGGSGSSTIQRVFILLNGSIYIQYGSNVYGSMNDAISALAAGADSFTQAQQTVGTSVLAGFIVLNKGATDLTNTSQAQFFAPSVSSGSSSAALSKFDDLLDTPVTKVGNPLGLVRVNVGGTDLEYDVPLNTSSTDTPSLKFGGNASGFVYEANTCNIVRVGKLAHIEIYIKLSTKGTGTGRLSMLLPTVFNKAVISKTSVGLTGTSTDVGNILIFDAVASGAVEFIFYKSSGTDVNYAELLDTDCTDTLDIRTSFFVEEA